MRNCERYRCTDKPSLSLSLPHSGTADKGVRNTSTVSAPIKPPIDARSVEHPARSHKAEAGNPPALQIAESCRADIPSATPRPVAHYEKGPSQADIVIDPPRPPPTLSNLTPAQEPEGIGTTCRDRTSLLPTYVYHTGTFAHIGPGRRCNQGGRPFSLYHTKTETG